MNDGPVAARLRFGRRLADRVRRTLLPGADGAASSAPGGAESGGTGRAPDRQGRGPELRQVRAQTRAAEAEHETLLAERDRLRQERLRLQEELGAQHGKRVMPRLKVEKTNGVPSFVVGTRMMQRVYRRGEDPAAGIDGLGSLLADPAAVARFARSHGVPVLQDASQAPNAQDGAVVVHAFKGEVGLVEVRGPGTVRHLTADGSDPGDVRPAAAYDPDLPVPEGLPQMCAWSQILSAHLPRPYVQIAWSPGAPPRLQRLDVDPDRIPVLVPEWDERLGRVFDGAYARFLLQPFRRGGLANTVPGGTFTYEERS